MSQHYFSVPAPTPAFMPAEFNRCCADHAFAGMDRQARNTNPDPLRALPAAGASCTPCDPIQPAKAWHAMQPTAAPDRPIGAWARQPAPADQRRRRPTPRHSLLDWEVRA